MQVSLRLALALLCLLVTKTRCESPSPAIRDVDKQKASSSPVCDESLSDSIVNDIIEWIRESGGIVDARQEVRKASNITSPYNVCATSFIPKDTVLLAVPWDLVLEPKNDFGESPLCDTVEILSNELAANKENKSKFGPYLRYLESVADPITLPSAWSPGGKELLKKVLGENLLTDVNAIDKAFRVWKKDCVNRPVANDPREDAAHLLLGYQSPNPAEDNWYQLIPFYDFYSPKEGGDCNTLYGQDDYREEMVVVANRDIEAGEVIHTPRNFGQSSDDEGKQFIDSGRIEKHYSLSFSDPSTVRNKDMPVKFDIDSFVDESGKRVYNITWTEGVRPHSRAYDQIEAEIHRMKEIVTLLPLDALNYLYSANKIEQKAIEEYAWTLIDVLSALLETRLDPRPATPWTLHDHEVAGVNLATYNLEGVEEEDPKASKEKPYELFEDFDMSDRIIGNENWKDMIEYRRKLERPTVSFYVDKVARKRWLPEHGFPQAKQFVLQYGSELTETGNKDEEAEALYKLIPDKVDYAAKPSHHSEGVSVWLVSHDKETNTTMFSSTARQLNADKKFNKMNVAKALTKHLHAAASPDESWILRNVRPGVVLEERLVEVDHFDRAPAEFNCFVIWGRLWVAQLNHIEGQDRYAMSWMHRDGSFIEGKEEFPEALDYVDFPRVVEMAETLGRNKDMFRVDIFVGIPASSPSLRANATKAERMAAVEYAVNECEIYPTTSFRWWPQLAQDGARLWVAGYKMGNYRTIPNDEVPKEFAEKGYLPEKP